MLKYDVLWSDGNGAASRGMGSDGYVKTHITADNESEMWKLAYLLRIVQLLKSASMKNLNSIKEELEDYGYEDDEIDELLYKDDYSEDDLDDINLDGIDGGDPWIISITLNGEEIYNCGCEFYSEDDDEDW